MTDSNTDSPIIQIPLTKGYSTIVSPEDEAFSSLDWSYRDGYAGRTIVIEGKTHILLLHRMIMERVLDRPLVNGELVDHWNKNTLDNTRSNLRLANRAQNGMNRKVNSNSKSGYKGVYEFRGRWRSVINAEGRCISLGYHSTPELAAEEYNRAALKYFGEFASLNVIRETDPANIRTPKKMGRPRKK